MDGIDVAVRNTILELVRETNPSCDRVEDHDGLTELGLKSLDLARMVAELDLSLDADPFSELVAMTSVRTVGDVVTAYRRFFESSSKEDDTELAEGRRRAAARAGAMSALKEGRDRSNGD